MNNDEKILAILSSVQLAIADLKVYQFEANARLDKLENRSNTKEPEQAPVMNRLDKLAASHVGLLEKTDRLEARILKVEAGQTYVNRKMDALAVEDAKILKGVAAIQDKYKEDLNRISSEIEGLSNITKENMFTIAKLKHT